MPRLDKKVIQQPFAIAVVLLVALSAGCAGSQGFNRAAMNEVLHVDPCLGSREPRSIATRAPPSRSRFASVSFLPITTFPNHQSLRKVEWLSADREQLLHGLAPLRDQQILADIFVLMDSTVQAENIDGIRQAGARYGADAVLIVDGSRGNRSVQQPLCLAVSDPNRRLSRTRHRKRRARNGHGQPVGGALRMARTHSDSRRSIER